MNRFMFSLLQVAAMVGLFIAYQWAGAMLMLAFGAVTDSVLISIPAYLIITFCLIYMVLGKSRKAFRVAAHLGFFVPWLVILLETGRQINSEPGFMTNDFLPLVIMALATLLLHVPGEYYAARMNAKIQKRTFDTSTTAAISRPETGGWLTSEPIMRLVVSKRLKNIALILWAVSLLLPGIVFRDTMYGYLILMIGWLGSPLCLAWWSNVLLIPAFRTLHSPDVIRIRWVVLAGILALDTFRLSWAPTNEGGGTDIVYGYGAGAVLWFCAIFVLWIATGQRILETFDDSRRGKVLRNTGAAVLTLLIASTLVKATVDRVSGNVYERERLSLLNFKSGGVLVKRGAVCTIEPHPVIPLTFPVGAIDMSDAIGIDYGSPFDLFTRGVRVVRLNGIDFAYREHASIPYFDARRAPDPPAVLVKNDVDPLQRQEWLRIEVPSSGKRVSYVWEHTRRYRGDSRWSDETCPEKRFPDQMEKTLMLRSLQIDDDLNKSITHIQHEIVKADEKLHHVVEAERVTYMEPEMLDTGCPPDIELGFKFVNPTNSSDVRNHIDDLGIPVRLGEMAHFQPLSGREPQLHCSGGFAYLSGWTSTDVSGQRDLKGEAKRELMVRKIRVSDGSTVWTVRAPITSWVPSDPDGRSPGSIQVTGLRETRLGLFVSLSIKWWKDFGSDDRFPTQLHLNIPLDGVGT